MTTDTIAAIATAAGTGGVAIIRLSGPNSLAIASKMFVPLKKCKVEQFEPYKMYSGSIQGDGFTDFGLCVYFKAPKSFTGEDVVEFHCHGGVELSRSLLKRTFDLGARSAERGEFTKRAFLNGKISLASAEGMVDMINAESLAEVRAGSSLYHEKLTNRIKQIQSQLTDLLASIAADVDYPEEDIERDELGDIKVKLSQKAGELQELIQKYAVGKKIKQGVSVAIVGKPNTGKSSLLNRLLGYNKAIVSNIAGTTRDIVEGTIELDGMKYCLFDTAGMRESAGEIEAIGIDLAKQAARSADVVVFLSEGDNDEEERAIAQSLVDCNVLRVFNKCDKKPCQGDYDVVISATTGENIEQFLTLLKAKTPFSLSQDSAFVIEERHHNALVRATQSLNNAIEGVGQFPLDVLSVDILNCWNILGEITGETATEDIINTVFEKFCVGK
jgi:tRNA modification GTPase